MANIIHKRTKNNKGALTRALAVGEIGFIYGDNTVTLVIKDENGKIYEFSPKQKAPLSNCISGVTSNGDYFVMGSVNVSSGQKYCLQELLNSGEYLFGNDKNSKLKSLDVSQLDTSNITTMRNMFFNCSNIKNLDVSNFDTSNVSSMAYMFSNCSSLTELDLSNWDTSNLQDMNSMFYNCSSLTELDLSNWDTSNVSSMTDFNHGCYSLQYLNISGWDLTKLSGKRIISNSLINNLICDNIIFPTYSACLFQCTDNNSPQYISLQNVDTSKVTSMAWMFQNCSSLTSLDLSNFDTSNVTDMMYMFFECRSLESLDLSNWNTSNVLSMISMFYGCSSLTSLDLRNFDTSNVVNMGSMFYGCSSLTSLDLSSFDISNVVNMGSMFYGCSSLTSLDLSSFDISNVVNMSSMFQNCSSLTSLTLGNLQLAPNGGNAYSMFRGCPSNLKIRCRASFKSLAIDNAQAIQLPLPLCNCESNQWEIIENDIENDNCGEVKNVRYWITLEVDNIGYNEKPQPTPHFINLTNFGEEIEDNTVEFTFVYKEGSKSGTTITDDITDGIPYYGLIDRQIYCCCSANGVSAETTFTQTARCQYTSSLTGTYSGNTLTSGEQVESLNSINTSAVTSMDNLFSGCTLSVPIELNCWDTSNVTSMNSMMREAKFTSIDLSHWDTSQVTNMTYAFNNCSATTINIYGWNTSSVTNMSRMFRNCRALSSLTLGPNFTVKNAKNVNEMFGNGNISNVLNQDITITCPPEVREELKSKIGNGLPQKVTWNPPPTDGD